MEGLQHQVAGLATADKVTQDAQVYAERDGRRLLLGGQRLKTHFETCGAAGVRALMIEWL